MKSIDELLIYLESVSFELDELLAKTKRESSKLQDVLEAISPNRQFEPRDSVFAPSTKKSTVFRGFNSRVTAQVSNDPYGEFQKALEKYNKLPSLPRERLCAPFINRILDFSRLTPIHIMERMIPSVCKMKKMIQGISSLDLSNPGNMTKAQYTYEQIEKVVASYEQMMKDYGLNRRVDSIGNEKNTEFCVKQPQKQSKVNSDNFETIGNLTPKQLNEFYKMRGIARQTHLLSQLKQYTAESFINELSKYSTDCSDEDSLDAIVASTRSFRILTNTKRIRSLISN